MTNTILVMVTCGYAKEAKRIARRLVDARLAACVNISAAPVQSIYRWKGKVETAKEILLLVKTTRKRFSALEREIRRLHSYDTPEIIALPIVGGSHAYLQWIAESVRPTGRGDNDK
ncbi:MAG TPA: divalent-cation tolerance protein CutA [Candidatus Limnocylindrales bacterium]|nr:divalent-cation tolerance protein CutA [Candidatus Limnocylindrales bacterium]